MGLVQIAIKDIGAFDADGSDFIGLGLTHERAVIIHKKNLHLIVRKSNANGTDFLFPVVRVNRRGTCPLGKAIPLYEFHAAVGLKSFEKLHREGGGPANRVTK